ncbi:MAG TPA: F-box protein [Rhabdochlamydiaceae bacterium]|nr:F-box protein [Rhabdochlamydiaceae bacterium]
MRIDNSLHYQTINQQTVVFPAEVRETIFYYLDVKGVSVASQVCKSWYGTSKSFYIVLNQLKEIESLTFNEILNWLQIIQHRCHKNLSVLDLIQKCPNLKNLDLSYSTVNDEDIANLPHLKELELCGCTALVDPDFNHFPTLEHLNLKGCDHLTKPKLNQLPCLNYLNVESCSNLQISIAELKSIFPEPVQLKYDDFDYYFDQLEKFAATAFLFWNISRF